VKVSAVILAAGKGVRMVSALPKILHPVAGKPMTVHIIDQVKAAGISDIVLVIGFGRQQVEEALSGRQIKFVVQEQQLGTGHALMHAAEAVDHDGQVLVLAGDTPLLTAALLKELIDYHKEQGAKATVLSCMTDNPYGYGRIIRDNEGYLERIVEEKDADADQKTIKEINSGIYCFDAGLVFDCLSQLKNNNAQQEYYLTEVFEIMKRENKPVAVFMSPDSESVYGINDREQLAFAESVIRRRKNLELMKGGVTISDPLSTFIDSEVKIGPDTVILPFTLIEGSTVIGQNCVIGPGTRISSSLIGNGVHIESSRINEAEIADDCNIGPFAYLRPGVVLHNGVKVGDFVEVKKSIIGENSKIPHLSYVGDAQVGKGVNIGAGTITCNYDGQHKYPTVLEDGVFIGSNTNLVAPVRIGKNSTTGAGSTITKDVEENSLAIERAPQKNISGWAKRSKE
jgi:bifunctional UDP-N-acetylglucosamine pyrophosphorylase/glucosamine-1-phosphate N-acetyltransferase